MFSSLKSDNGIICSNNNSPINNNISLSPLFPCGASDVGASEALKGSQQDIQTSLLAFENNKDFFVKREDQVLSVIKNFSGLNNREIGVKLDLPVNCITGRVYSLRKKGLVVFAGFKIDEVTRQKTDTWRID